MKIQLELNIGDETYLNFWDGLHGKDVCTVMKGGRLFLLEVDDDEKVKKGKEISFANFVKKVRKIAEEGSNE